LLGDTKELSRRNALDIAIRATNTDAFDVTKRIAIRDLINRDATAFILGVERYSSWELEDNYKKDATLDGRGLPKFGDSTRHNQNIVNKRRKK
jgi:hypothetical protein